VVCLGCDEKPSHLPPLCIFRPQAEAAFAELKKHPDACAQQLVRALRQSPSLEARALCAVLLRKVCFDVVVVVWGRGVLL
jgi:hypothetical protein